MSSSDEVINTGSFFLGACVAGLVSLLMTCDDSNPQTIQAFEKLCKHNVPITCSHYGHYYLWDEKTKSSFEINTDAVITMAKDLK